VGLWLLKLWACGFKAVDFIIQLYTTKSLVSSANNTREVIYINDNNRGPKTEPWGTPLLTDDNRENSPFITKPCFFYKI